MPKLRFISLCSGIEAASVAFKQWQAIAFAENDNFCSRFLAWRYPDVPNLRDITKVDWQHLEGYADIAVGGPPCQAFSVSGLRGSLDDARGQLTLEYVKILDAVKPPLLFYEQVPGILSTKDNVFGCLLAGLVGTESPLPQPSRKRGKPRWSNAGMAIGPKRAVAWRVLDAQHFGVPQRRKRLYLVGFDFRNAHRLLGASSNADLRRLSGIPAAILFQPESGSGYSATGGTSGDKVALGNGNYTQRNSSRASGLEIEDLWCFSSKDHGQDVGRVCPTIRSGSFKDSWQNGGVPPGVTYTEKRGLVKVRIGRRLTPIECLRAQGFPGDYLDFSYQGKPCPPDGLKYKAIGNSWAVPVVRWIGDRINLVIDEVRASFQQVYQ